MPRKLYTMFVLLAVLGVGFGAVRALSAQANGGMMPMMRDCPMMGAMAHGPGAALRHKAELGLTAEQAQRLEALLEEAPAREATMGRMQEFHAKMNAAIDGATFDENAARAAFEEMSAMHTQMGVAMLRTRHAVRQILTAEQREKLSQLGRSGMMHGMHGKMGRMKDCPMMKGGMMGGHHGSKQEG